MQKPIEFKNNKSITLRGFVHKPRKYDAVVIVLHGFPGRCNSDRVIKTCKHLQRLGYLALRFDFSGTNISDGNFEDKLMSQEVKEIKYAIDFLEKKYKFKKLVLYGHSTGAIDAALYAYKDKRIDKLILSGGSANLKEAARYDFTDEQVRDFWTKGYIIYKRRGWYYNKRLRKAFYDEFFRLDVLGSLGKFKGPVLIIHGTEDEYVPAKKDPYEYYRAANKPKKLVFINGSDHSFKKPKYLKEVIKHIDEFIKKR